MKESDGQVADILRAADRDRYLSALYAPAEKREGLFALYAFNAEIAAIRDRIRDPLPGEIRLQWWRDVLAAPKGAGEGHPVAVALIKTIAANSLPPAAFDNYLEARIFDLYDDPMPSRGDLEGYCGETASVIVQLAALILDRASAPDHAELAGHAGCAQAIAGLLRLLPMHRARGQCYVPRDILSAAGTSPEEFIAGDAPEAPRRAVEAMIALANHHLNAFREGARRLPQRLRPAFLPVALVPAYLDKLARDPGRALRVPADISEVRRHWIMFRTAVRGWR
ncbi:phytoene/squalene synthase family protein [Mesorhizobium sp. 1B3]|uniref:phytoene/squalene synthase family protein n=1 Tax=Mesorhizobium sp. 1B3 TaxID=3243599 RepID=UPI003D97EF0E